VGSARGVGVGGVAGGLGRVTTRDVGNLVTGGPV
jgi:hypothetical protein